MTGALGGIGSEICRQLVTAGYKIIATVVPREEDREKQWLQSEGFQDSDVRFVLTDLNNHEAATAAIQKQLLLKVVSMCWSIMQASPVMQLLKR